MARAALWHIALGLVTTGLLMGCVEGAGPSADRTDTASPATPPKRAGKGAEVEAPDVFQSTDSALWDGRPSLGGIWVASPDAISPERVVMFNPATGKTVKGALFRRERDNPGPTLQISSDAAEALGMLAGQPTEIQVTAVRKVEPEEPAEAEVPAEGDPAADGAVAEGTADAEGAPAAADADAAETAALATAALGAADAAADAVDPAAAAVEGAAEAGTAAAVATTEKPKRKTWKERRAEAKAKREAEKAAKAAAEAAASGTEVAPVADVAGAPTVETAGVDAIETAPLDARSAEATAAAETAATAAPAPEAEPRKTRRQKKAEAEAAAAAAAAAPPAPTGRPIQVASFSKEENAKRAVDALTKIGVTAQPQKSERGGKVVWGVVALGDEALLKTIKGAGFADAYFLQ